VRGGGVDNNFQIALKILFQKIKSRPLPKFELPSPDKYFFRVNSLSFHHQKEIKICEFPVRFFRDCADHQSNFIYLNFDNYISWSFVIP